MVLEHHDYRHYLKSELADRIAANPAYSLRAFARDIGLAPTSVSQVLSGRKRLSPEMGLRVASRLKLDSQQTDYFHLLIQYDATRDPGHRGRLLERMNTINPGRRRTDLSVELFRMISEWYHYGILRLTEVEGFELTPSSAARRLGISRFEAETAIQRLLELELLEKDAKTGRYRRVKGDLLVQSDVPNQALRKYHRRLLELATESIEDQSPQERPIGSEVVAISPELLPRLNEAMEEFFSKVLALAREPQVKTDVYHVGVQIFNLTPGRARRPGKPRGGVTPERNEA